MRYTVFSILLIMAAAGFAQESNEAQSEIPDINTIVNKANIMAYYQGKDGKASVKMVITDKQGRVRNREFNILRKDEADGGDQYYFVYFQRPADVRKMVFMVHKHAGMEQDDDRWLYLPSLDLVKRIAAGDKRTSFVGSDYLYEDVSGRSLDADTHTLDKVTDTQFIVRNEPKKPENVKFKYYTVAIDRKTFMPVRMEYFDENNTLYRTIESADIKEIQGYPTVTKAIVKDLKSESTTEMTFGDIQYDIGLDDDIFTERYLRRPPREAIR